jgi:polyisoprenoid-binding protein YceI
MKSQAQILKWSKVVILALMPMLIFAQQSIDTKNVQVFVNGTSTLHDWRSEVTNARLTGHFEFNGTELNNFSGVNVKIPVTSIKSTKGSVMDKKTWTALKYTSHPNISFKITKLVNLKEVASGYTMEIAGLLTIAGKSKSIVLRSECTYLGNNTFEFSGLHALKMTDFNVDPPTALLGSITTGDDITIDFIVRIKTNS